MGKEYSVERWKDFWVFKEFAEKSTIHVILVAGLARGWKRAALESRGWQHWVYWPVHEMKQGDEDALHLQDPNGSPTSPPILATAHSQAMEAVAKWNQVHTTNFGYLLA